MPVFAPSGKTARTCMIQPEPSPSPPMPSLPMPSLLAMPVLALLVLPWIEPFAPGPSSSAVPLLVSWLCASLALGLGAGRRPCWIAWGWLAAALLGAVFGLMQYFGVTEIARGLVNYTEPGTAFGNLRQRNQFASQMSIGVLAAMYLAAWGRPGRWLEACTVLLAVASAASTSRTGLLQLLVIAAVTLAWHRGWRARPVQLALLALAVHAAATLLLPVLLLAATGIEASGLLDRVASGPACASRLVLWSNVLELIAQRPWTGWGVGELDYAHFAHLYLGPRFCDILDNAHNLPLHVAVEFGVPAALLLLGALAAWVVRARPWAERDPTRQLAWGVLLMIGLHSLLEYPLWYGPFQLAALLAWLLLEKPAQAAGAGRWRPLLAFGAVPLALGYAAWDYHRISQPYLQPQERAPAYRERTLEKAQASLLFARQARFAQLSVMRLTRDNASQYHLLALDMLHFSPEPRVIEGVIDSAMLLGDEPTAKWHMARYRRAFPAEYAQWLAGPSAREGVR